MLRGNYLKDLLYFDFGMQLGIDLCKAINEQTTLSVMQKAITSHRLLMFRKTFSTVSASFVPSRVRVHSDLPYNFSTASI